MNPQSVKTTQPWPEVSGEISLKAGEIHLWSADLDRDEAQVIEIQGLLTGDELERAQRFKFWRDRRRYIMGRGILRLLLGRYIKTAPEKIQIGYNAFGKPYLPDQNPRFNLAHSQDLILYAFCLDQEIGVDLECNRSISDPLGIAARFFAPAEIKIFLAAPADQLMELFFSYWTLKEAFIKAKGHGLSYPLDSFEIAMSEDGKPYLISLGEESREVADWALFSVTPEPGCAAAVAVRGKNWQLLKQKFAR